MKKIKCNFCGYESEDFFYQMKLSRKKGEYNGNYNICIRCVWKLMSQKEQIDKKNANY